MKGPKARSSSSGVGGGRGGRGGRGFGAASLLLAALVALAWLPLFASALSRHDAGKIDWHVPRIGVPHVSSDSATQYLSPRFHRLIKPWQDVRDKAQTAIFVATESNAVGAINPRNGALVWRQVLDDDDGVIAFTQHSDHALSISGAGGANVRLYHGLTGHVIWEASQHHVRDGILPEAGSPGVDAVFLPSNHSTKTDGDVLTLANGRTVRRLDGRFGKEAWRWDLDDTQATKKLARLVATPDKVYAIAVSRSAISASSAATVSKIVVYALSHGGQLLSTHEIQSNLPNGSADLLSLPWNPRPNLPPNPASARPYVAWRNADGTVRVAPLDAAAGKAAQPQVLHSKRPADSTFASITDVGLGDRGLFIAQRSDGMGEVLRVDARGKLNSMWEFEEDAHDAVYSGTYDRAGHAYINRVFFSRGQHLLNFHTFWADARNGGEGQVTGFSFQYDHDLHGNVLAAPFEASPVSQYQLVTRATLVTSSGSIRMIQEDKTQWLLEEGLTQIAASLIVDLPERKLTTLKGGAAALDRERFVGRLIRHVIALQDLPSYLVNFARRFASGDYGALEPAAGGGSVGVPGDASSAGAAPSTSGTTTMVKSGNKPVKEVKAEDEKPTSLAPRVASANTTATLYRDPFGFRKLVIAATTRGKLYAIDTIRKETYVWEKSLVGYGQGEGEPEPKVDVKLLSLVRPLSSDGRGPLISIVAEIELEAGIVATRVFELDPLTGEFAEGSEAGATIFVGRALDAFLLPIEDADSRQQVVGIVDRDHRVHLFPDTLSVAQAFEPLAESFYFALASGVESKQLLTGHATEGGVVSSVHASQQVWQLPLPAGEAIVSRIAQVSEHVASLGRVRGDRSTLYKYLNPHAELITTVSPATASAHLYLLDTVTGSVVFEVELEGIELSRGVQASFVENWIVYSYAVRTADEGLQTRMVSTELYEQPGAEQTWLWRGNFSSFTGDSSNPGSNSTAPLSYAQTFLFAHGVRALGSTTTKFGISLKNLLVATDRDTIVSVPRKLLDPRRPLGKPSKSEAEEYMVPYDPLIPNEPKWTLSHVFPVAKLQRLQSAPALLESTSLVLAYGLDMFWTRDAPSGQFDVLQETFNKPQLLLTIAGLSAGILVTRPIVRGRALSARWSS
ncbi:uncharacterized protein PFL1_01583 [Pseudozyma flocculosa PF-1]|uniref:ER membrane protein complex subunit 1 n=1 Tax=Pseudozyma flocculosa TaxID=84751 RepID=A0A5C3EYY5_9BASI|nr:uncharacterized protein PFL1_01583 [Pseudozyma flocculosa PF-1]EPQ30682.1 hypothetical protein PFL1_01583 [Pseudozyma flocculosa PF-1]SPO36985.1 related to EMC1 - member of a transmembrane complex required for efficient folding of proteins in the ER [Pseudozyma flocculosa]